MPVGAGSAAGDGLAESRGQRAQTQASSVEVECVGLNVLGFGTTRLVPGIPVLDGLHHQYRLEKVAHEKWARIHNGELFCG